MKMKVKFYRDFNMSTFKNSLFRATFTYISESTPNRVGSNSDYFSAIGQDIFGEVLSALCSQYFTVLQNWKSVKLKCEYWDTVCQF